MGPVSYLRSGSATRLFANGENLGLAQFGEGRLGASQVRARLDKRFERVSEDALGVRVLPARDLASEVICPLLRAVADSFGRGYRGPRGCSFLMQAHSALVWSTG